MLLLSIHKPTDAQSLLINTLLLSTHKPVVAQLTPTGPIADTGALGPARVRPRTAIHSVMGHSHQKPPAYTNTPQRQPSAYRSPLKQGQPIPVGDRPRVPFVSKRVQRAATTTHRALPTPPIRFRAPLCSRPWDFQHGGILNPKPFPWLAIFRRASGIQCWKELMGSGTRALQCRSFVPRSFGACIFSSHPNFVTKHISVGNAKLWSTQPLTPNARVESY